MNHRSPSLPYVEPYTIRTMSKAKRRATDPTPREVISLLPGQEAQQASQARPHMLVNEAAGAGGSTLSELEAELARDFEQSPSTRSLMWNLSYM